jgi:hypothetical protein
LLPQKFEIDEHEINHYLLHNVNKKMDYDEFRKVCLLFGTPNIDPHSQRDEVHNISTDQILTIFDMGYQLGLVKQKSFNKINSRNLIDKILVVSQQLKEIESLSENNPYALSHFKDLKEIIETFKSHLIIINENIEKNIEISISENKNTIQDEKLKRHNEETFHNIQNNWFNLEK